MSGVSGCQPLAESVLIGFIFGIGIDVAVGQLKHVTGTHVTEVFRRLNENPDSETYPGLVIIRFAGPLYFATANALRNKVREVATDVVPRVTMVLIDMEGAKYLDLEGSDMLNEITKNMKGEKQSV